MKYIASVFFIGASYVTLAQCGATSVTPTPQAIGICEGSSQTISFAAGGTCSGNYEYQVELGGNTLQTWSTTNSFTISPTSTATYTVLARCSACPTTVASDTFLIEVIEEPVIVADTFVCHGTAASMSATVNSGSVSWWDAVSGGNQLSTTGNYTSPTLTSDQTYYVHVSGVVTGGGAQGSVLITECGLAGFQPGADNDYVEISNLYSTAVNTAGWKVALSGSYNNINTVNSILWNLPNSFSPCSILSKTDISNTQNYWGSNILWNPSQNGWAMILDDNWQVVDFVAWGWTAAQLNSFGPTISGNLITLGTEWTGASCPSACGSTASPQSITRIGSNDNNNAGDFVCQATSLNQLNPSLTCGWTASNLTCPYPVNVVVDMPPTASNGTDSLYQCIADVPAPDPAVITDEMDDYSTPTVVFQNEVSSGSTCPQTITRTYRVSDSCSNYVDVTHTIIVNDDVAPVMDAAPSDTTVACYADVPAAVDLDWTDNCLGSGTVSAVEVSDGLTCPETITRTWTITDDCGNTATETQTIVVHDDIAPVIDAAPADVTVSCYADVPAMVSLNWSDNCDGSGVLNGVEVSDGLSCPETLTRTWTYTDGCGNTATETQVIVIHDDIAPTMDPAPADLFVQCYADVPPMTALNWNDNCDGSGVDNGTEVSDGLSCPETITRTWSYTDGCGNNVTRTQTIVVHDVTPPTASGLPSIQVPVLPAPDASIISDAADNCGTPNVAWVGDVSNGGFCPEIVTRTYSVTDDCGNETLITQDFTIGDPIPDVSFIANPTELSNLQSGLVEFTNTTSGAVWYEWDFGDLSPISNEENPTHEFNNDESAGYVVQLTAYSEFGCSDSFTVVISVIEELLYYVPNAFTPDGDEYNQTFKPIFESGFDTHDYTLLVFNRWGETIFESHDYNIGWDGTYNGEVVQEGTYVWRIEFGLEYTDARKIITGHVSLLK